MMRVEDFLSIVFGVQLSVSKILLQAKSVDDFNYKDDKLQTYSPQDSG
jgi:hypothetical protein